MELASVIIPVFNGERYLKETIKSIYRQDYKNLEIIAVNDGSSDNSLQILKEYHDIIIIDQLNSGPAKARNIGTDRAKGEFIAFIDQDDIWLPSKISTQIKYLKEDLKTNITICHQSIILSSLENIPEALKKQKEEIINKPRPCFAPSGIVCKKKAFELVGFFDENYPFYSEAEWFNRAKLKNQEIKILHEVLVQKRFHNKNLSYNLPTTSKELLKIARNFLIKKRESE